MNENKILTISRSEQLPINENMNKLKDVLVKIENVFSNKDLVIEIKQKIQESLNEIEANINLDYWECDEEKCINQIVLATKNIGKDALKDRKFDRAIKILSEADRNLLPAFSSILTPSLKKELENVFLEELENAYLKKGDLGEIIKLYDKKTEDSKHAKESKDYIDAQLYKANLFYKKGEFKTALSILTECLDLVEHIQNAAYHKAEINRLYGMALRGQGNYEEALNWFEKANKEFKKINDNIGLIKTIWGKGILFYLKGDWQKAIEIWQYLLHTFETTNQNQDIFKGEPKSKTYLSLLIDYFRTLQLCGNFENALDILNKAFIAINDLEEEFKSTYLQKLYLLSSELHLYQNQIFEAANDIDKVRELYYNQNNKDTISELYILKHEVKILINQSKSEIAREKLQRLFPDLKSNWEQALYYRILAQIEKSDLNYGLACKAFKKSLEISNEIGVFPISDELSYLELLIEMSKTGNQNALDEANSLLEKLEEEIEQRKLVVLSLECKILRGHLYRILADFDSALKVYSDVVRDAETKQLLLQKTKALNYIEAIEQQGQKYNSMREISVLRYLDEARRILEEHS